ncbi:hypothetical protein AMTR_s00041p00206530 [Amborella trichopoda]|uniref:Uncharacterized protein n=1 Tax=Amborella trichopoda TaxID=13333 RepID=W1Q0I0_AMBTC|nr:hypothetical protein AMTR_s00041p00206530 [Amborella trichopoda]
MIRITWRGDYLEKCRHEQMRAEVEEQESNFFSEYWQRSGFGVANPIWNHNGEGCLPSISKGRKLHDVPSGPNPIGNHHGRGSPPSISEGRKLRDVPSILNPIENHNGRGSSTSASNGRML